MSLTVRAIGSMHDIGAAAWDALSGDDNPFIEHAFLASLEDSGSASADTGWMPAHLVVHDGDTLVGAAPMYVKDHSYGEYIFDWSWANACQRGGVPYYPKLVVAVPFTPATGPRALVAPGADRSAVFDALARGAHSVADAVEASSIHWLFTPPGEVGDLAARGFRARKSYQFHWERQDWRCFEDYLSAMTSKRRKEVRRERRAAADVGLDLAVETLTDWTDDDLGALYACYQSTIGDRGAHAYLTRAWWMALPRTLGHRALVATARRDGALVAAALAFRKGDQLFGRYWGALEDVPALHFELSYYQFINYGLAHGVRRFEAGAQGMHKISRGFLPAVTHSAHWLRHPGLDRAVAGFLVEEAAHVEQDVAHLAGRSPFRDAGEAP